MREEIEMISNAVIGSMVFSVIFSFFLFGGLIIFYKKKTGIAVKPLIIGGIGFIIFTQVLEKILHVIVISNFPNYADYPWLFGLYGGMAAGLFEELGRFLLFTWLLNKFLDYKGGLSFGVGWGGIEAVILTLTMTVPNMMFAFMINSGTLETALGAKMANEQIVLLKNILLNQDAFTYLLGCVERFFASFMQIALGLLVLLAVVKKKFTYVIYAIIIHAAIDFPLVFFQTGSIKSLWVIELYVAIIGILSMFYIKKVQDSDAWTETLSK